MTTATIGTASQNNHKSNKGTGSSSTENRYSITSLSSAKTTDTSNTEFDHPSTSTFDTALSKPGIDSTPTKEDQINSKGKRGSLTHGSALQQQRKKSTASVHLIENQFQQVIPIAHTHSSEEQIHGSYTVVEPGNCVLIFGK